MRFLRPRTPGSILLALFESLGPTGAGP